MSCLSDREVLGGRPHEGYRDLRRALRLAPIRRTLSTPPLTRGPCPASKAQIASTSHRSPPCGRPVRAGIVLCGRSKAFHFTHFAILIVFFCPGVTIPASIGCTAPSPAGITRPKEAEETSGCSTSPSRLNLRVQHAAFRPGSRITAEKCVHRGP